MDARPRNLRAMLSEAKDLSELMVDLAYAALYFGDPDMAEEVSELEEQMNELVHDMRTVSILAARNPREAEAMASVLQVVTAIERIAKVGVDRALGPCMQRAGPRRHEELPVDDLADEVLGQRLDVGVGRRLLRRRHEARIAR